MAKKNVNQSIALESKTSWAKVAIVIIAGLLFAYVLISIIGSNLIGITANTIFNFVVITLLACVLGLLLDIRKILLLK